LPLPCSCSLHLCTILEPYWWLSIS
jgi:hypothetical protein